MTESILSESPDPEDVLLGRAQSPIEAENARLDPALPAEVFSTGARRSTSPTSPVPARLPGRSRGRDEDVLARGAIVDKYRIDGMLGKGGFAVVYRATHLLLGTKVALKLLRPTMLERQPALAAQLCEEARFAARINHPNVVRVLDVTSHKLTYIVMEYIDGSSLGQRIDRGGPLAAAPLLRIGLQVVAGLQAGLEQGLIHRDIKPANILVTKQGEGKLVDFGLARQSAGREGVPRLRAHAIVGTYGYMSPEQAEDPESVDFRADIYSLGVTLYEAATGSLPFPANDPATCISLHKSRPIPPAHERMSTVPETVSSLISWMLAKKREERPPSYEKLHQSMRRTLDALTGNSSLL
jgi:eukaryotic-like serine/threonine-protein kinase